MGRHRPGITLLEVLAAIFILGIGTLAILVLFPLGALNMARALKDDRCGAIAVNAHSMAIARNMDVDLTVIAELQRTPPGYLAPNPNGLGYPILVDPYFFHNGGLTNMGAVAGGPGTGTPGVTRISPDYIRNLTVGRAEQIDRWFSLLDDMTFETNGRPKLVGTLLERQGYYTFTYLLRRNQAAIPTSTRVWVIVYSGRGVQVPTAESVFRVTAPNNTALGAANATTIHLHWTTGDPPALRRGSWIMDVSYNQVTVNLGGQPTPTGFLHGECYRVMDASRFGATNVMQVELQNGLARGNVRHMVVLENAVEVFDRGLLKDQVRPQP